MSKHWLRFSLGAEKLLTIWRLNAALTRGRWVDLTLPCGFLLMSSWWKQWQCFAGFLKFPANTLIPTNLSELSRHLFENSMIYTSEKYCIYIYIFIWVTGVLRHILLDSSRHQSRIATIYSWQTETGKPYCDNIESLIITWSVFSKIPNE